MVKLFIISAILLALCIMAMGIRIWLKGTFADTEVGHNPHMRKLGLRCAKEEEIARLRESNPTIKTDNNACSSCCCGSGECHL